jgi:hypothetical protein
MKYICPYDSDLYCTIWFHLMNEYETSDIDCEPEDIEYVLSDPAFIAQYESKFGVKFNED